MSGPFGLGDGVRDQSAAQALAETQVADAHRHQPNAVQLGRWPRGVTILRVLIGLVGAIVLLGWALTALNGGA
jgi:hypothetical protein